MTNQSLAALQERNMTVLNQELAGQKLVRVWLCLLCDISSDGQYFGFTKWQWPQAF